MNGVNCVFSCIAEMPHWHGTTIRVEPIGPLPRCRLKGMNSSDPFSSVWLGSGGSPASLGVCTPGDCPSVPEGCEYHRSEPAYGVFREGVFVEINYI